MRAGTNFFLYFGGRPGKHAFRAGCILFFSLNSPLLAQTVRPLIDENVVKGPGKNAKGKIEYINDSLQPLNVVLDLKSFTVSSTCELSYRPLDDGIHAKFSTMSFRIPPKQNFFVFYEASPDKLPSAFAGYATCAGFKDRPQGALRLPALLRHTL